MEKLDGAVNMMETKEKRTLAEMKKVKVSWVGEIIIYFSSYCSIS